MMRTVPAPPSGPTERENQRERRGHIAAARLGTLDEQAAALGLSRSNTDSSLTTPRYSESRRHKSPQPLLNVRKAAASLGAALISIY
jgi:hypothetical protein